MTAYRLIRNIWIVYIASAASIANAVTRPNVVLIISDDQTWTDYGFMGHPHLKTPNLDRLSSEGILYERGYVTAPLCRPSLVGIATGLFPHQTSIRGNDPLVSPLQKKDRELMVEMRKRMTQPMERLPSFIKLLKASGYATLQTGKWWEGDPIQNGFTHAMTHGDFTRGARHGDLGLTIGRKTLQPVYDFVDQAQASDQPFFIWYGVFLPHTPHNAPARLYNKYKNIAPNESTARYWANVEWFDEGCGQITDYLKSNHLYENTIFVFTSDNGWRPDPEKRNRFTRSKREPVEAGIRTPIFITHSGTIKPHRETEALASNMDIATTILASCGIKAPKEMSGLDLRDPRTAVKRNRVFVDVYEHDSDIDQLNNIENGLVARVLIDGWDKLIAFTDRNELYNLNSDPDDRTNLAVQYPKKVKELHRIIETWIKFDNIGGHKRR